MIDINISGKWVSASKSVEESGKDKWYLWLFWPNSKSFFMVNTEVKITNK